MEFQKLRKNHGPTNYANSGPSAQRRRLRVHILHFLKCIERPNGESHLMKRGFLGVVESFSQRRRPEKFGICRKCRKVESGEA